RKARASGDSLTCPVRPALLQKGVDPLLRVALQRVVGHHAAGPTVSLLLAQRQLIVEGALANPYRERACCQDGADKVHDCGVELVGGDNAIDKTQLKSTLGANRLAGDEHF